MNYFIQSLAIAFSINALNIRAQLFISQGNGAYDFDGNYYESVILSNGQEWMTSNLKTTHFSDGSAIELMSDANSWATTSDPAYTQYDNSASIAQIYGNLYNFYVAKHPRNACPTGWRVPNQNDWTDLTDALGGLGIAGGKLKAEGNALWAEPNFQASDEILFNGLPNGCRYDGGNFNNLTKYSFFWSSTELDIVYGWYRALKYNTDAATRDFSKKQSGYAIRCMKNIELSVDHSEKSQAKAFPNPTTSIINVSSVFSENAGIKLDDGAIDLTRYESGIYLLTIEDDTSITTIRIIRE